VNAACSKAACVLLDHAVIQQGEGKLLWNLYFSEQEIRTDDSV
jgi:hypothetical protein